jgi:hypothetical protein
MDSISVGTLNLLEAVRFLGSEIRVYNASSSECFGDTEAGMLVQTELNEASPVTTNSKHRCGIESAQMSRRRDNGPRSLSRLSRAYSRRTDSRVPDLSNCVIFAAACQEVAPCNEALTGVLADHWRAKKNSSA